MAYKVIKILVRFRPRGNAPGVGEVAAVLGQSMVQEGPVFQSEIKWVLYSESVIIAILWSSTPSSVACAVVRLRPSRLSYPEDCSQVLLPLSQQARLLA